MRNFKEISFYPKGGFRNFSTGYNRQIYLDRLLAWVYNLRLRRDTMESITERIAQERDLTEAEQETLKKGMEILDESKLPHRLKEIVGNLRTRHDPLKFEPADSVWRPGYMNPSIQIQTNKDNRIVINVTEGNEHLGVKFYQYESWDKYLRYTYEFPRSYKVSDLDLGEWFSWLLDETPEPWSGQRQFLIYVSKDAWKKLIKSLPKTEAETFKKRKKELRKN